MAYTILYGIDKLGHPDCISGKPSAVAGIWAGSRQIVCIVKNLPKKMQMQAKDKKTVSAGSLSLSRVAEPNCYPPPGIFATAKECINYSGECSLVMANLKILLKRLQLVIPVLLLLFTIFTGVADAAISTSLTIKWRPNPPQDQVIGYRLYYGSQSRFESNGTLKANFAYAYRIDFTKRVRCSGPTYTSCKDLSSQELQCENLFSATPKCTVSNLNQNFYFAMTGYTNKDESSYTYELIGENSPGGKISPGALVAINMLLLKR